MFQKLNESGFLGSENVTLEPTYESFDIFLDESALALVSISSEVPHLS